MSRRASSLGIIAFLLFASTIPAQTPPPVERAGQLIAEAQRSLAQVRDYTGTLVRQERIAGEVQPEQFIEFQIRQQPYSVHLKWISPRHLRGQEAIFVAGGNNNEIRARGTGILSIAGFVSLPINDPRVMRNSRHAITETGIGNMLNVIARSYEVERRLPAGEVTGTFAAYTFQQKPCTRMEVVHRAYHAGLYCYRCVVYFDNDNKLPVRVEVYDWPRHKGDPNGDLLECYSYINLKFNLGLTDAAFVEPER